jgi:hypothetical protein
MKTEKTHYLPFNAKALGDTICKRTSGYVTSLAWQVTCGRCRKIILAGWRARDASKEPRIDRWKRLAANRIRRAPHAEEISP